MCCIYHGHQPSQSLLQPPTDHALQSHTAYPQSTFIWVKMMSESVSACDLFAFVREGDAHRREEALDRRRGCRAAEVLPRHHLEVRELLAVLEPPKHRILLALVLDLRQREVLLQATCGRRTAWGCSVSMRTGWLGLVVTC